MKTIKYQVNSRQLIAFESMHHEFIEDNDKNYLFDLSHLAILNVEGERASEFLQGQLTCDLNEVTPEQMRRGALCDLKGRILALIDVIEWVKPGLQMILPQDLIKATKLSLEKAAQFSRVELKPATGYQLFGFYLKNEADIIPFNVDLPREPFQLIHQKDFCCYNIGNNVYIFVVETAAVGKLCEPFTSQSQWRGSLAWHALQLRQKQIEIYPESRGLFLPHRLGLQLTGYLNFNKGCYRGQEIIARTHYLAKLKHELKVFCIQTNESLRAGQKLFNENSDIEVGEIIDYCPLGEGRFIIAASVIHECPSNVQIENQKTILTLSDNI